MMLSNLLCVAFCCVFFKTQGQECLAPWATGYEWVKACKGEPLRGGAVMSGRSITDGDVYIGRTFEGEPGKITMKQGKMRALWTHSQGKSKCADQLVINSGVTHIWQPYKKGDQVPDGAVLAGETPLDGKVYVARNKYSEIYGSAAGKVNTDGNQLNNLWIHGNVMKWSEGEILVVKKPSEKVDCGGRVPASGATWAKVCKGELLRGGAVLAGHTMTDKDIYVGSSLGGEPGKVNLIDGMMHAIYSHSQGHSSCANLLLLHPEWSQEWVPYKKGDPIPDGALPVETSRDGTVFIGRNTYSKVYGSSTGKITQNGGNLQNMWIHGYLTSWSEGEILVVKRTGPVESRESGSPSFVNQAVSGWNPNVMCDGVRAQERAEWIQSHNGLSMNAAIEQVMREYPQQFSQQQQNNKWNPNVMCDGHRAQDRAEWLMQNKGLSNDAAKMQVMRDYPGAF